MLAEALGSAGDTAGALAALDDAFASLPADRTYLHFYEAEMHRLRGRMLLKGARPNEAAAAFRQALDIARGQGARSLELRAATDLACLWRRLGRQQDARRVLEDVYGWFTEGFETPDLRRAWSVLQETKGG
jgi:predicted ATPase